MDNSHRTAISRKALSAPARMIKHEIEDALKAGGRVLDYGCGKGTDAKLLGVDSYDSWYQQIMPEGQFDVVYCFYVLNVLPLDEARKVIGNIQHKLKRNGMAYASVRRDLKKEGVTRKGTYQRNVELLNATSIAHSRRHFELYQFEKTTPVVVI